MAEAPRRRRKIEIGRDCQCRVNDKWHDARVDSAAGTIEDTDYFRILFKGGLRRYDGDYPKMDIRPMPAADAAPPATKDDASMEEEEPTAMSVEDDAPSEPD